MTLMSQNGEELLHQPNQIQTCNQTGFQPLKCLILLHCCYNEFVKFPKMRVFENITSELA